MESPSPRSFGELVRLAGDLADQGRYRDAIDALTEANRARRTPKIERRLVQYRRRAVDVETPPGRPAWPPALDDPFPAVAGRLPEIASADLSGDTVGGAVLHHGAVTVRQLVTPEKARVLAHGIDEAFSAFDAWAALRAESSEESPSWPPESGPATWFSPHSKRGNDRRDWIRKSGAVWAADAPATLFDLFEIFRPSGGPGVLDVVRGYFGEEPALSVNKFTLRRVEATGPATWHQDGSFLGDDVRALNLWLCLSRCGEGVTDTPGLDLVPRRLDDLLDTGGKGAWTVNAISPHLVRERYGDEIARPAFEPGDALFFDERFLHKTGVSRGMTKPRHAVEAWFFAPSRFPDSYAPLAA